MEISRDPGLPPRNAAANVAFGSFPGLSMLPATDPFGRWQRAVALAAQGYYARARTQIAAVSGDDALQSLALSAKASWLRQLGWHQLAATLDGPAVRLAVAAPDSPRRVEAMCDAMTGLAADGIGQARPGVTTALLARVDEVLRPLAADQFWRQRVRLDWVSAETSLARGDANAALPQAESAFARAAAAGAVRHEIKSQLLVAAATAGRGDLEASAEQAAKVARRCAENGLLPLEWAASMLLAGVHPESGAQIRAYECAAEIERRGGRFR